MAGQRAQIYVARMTQSIVFLSRFVHVLRWVVTFFASVSNKKYLSAASTYPRVSTLWNYKNPSTELGGPARTKLCRKDDSLEVLIWDSAFRNWSGSGGAPKPTRPDAFLPQITTLGVCTFWLKWLSYAGCNVMHFFKRNTYLLRKPPYWCQKILGGLSYNSKSWNRPNAGKSEYFE